MSNLQFKNGIWHSKEVKEVSYPNDYNLCFSFEEDSFWFKHRKELLVDTVLLNPDFQFTFIDVGGGNGFMSKAAQDLGVSTILIEPAQEGVNNALKRGVKHIARSLYQDLKCNQVTPKIIGLFDVLEHIEDDSGLIQELSESMHKGDKLVLMVPAFNFLWSNEDKKAGHFRRYNLKSISNLLKNQGFTFEHKSYFFSWLVPLIIVSRKFKKENSNYKEHESTHRNSHVPIKIIRFIFSIFSKIERSLVKRNWSIPFGSSVFIVVKKE